MRERLTKQLDPAADVAERRSIDAEDAHRPRLDGCVADRPGDLDGPLRERHGLAGTAGEHEVRR